MTLYRDNVRNIQTQNETMSRTSYEHINLVSLNLGNYMNKDILGNMVSLLSHVHHVHVHVCL